jgi:hypothetical protein
MSGHVRCAARGLGCLCVCLRVSGANTHAPLSQNHAAPTKQPSGVCRDRHVKVPLSLRLRCKDAALPADRRGHRLEGGGKTATPVDPMFEPHGTVRRAGQPFPVNPPGPVRGWVWGGDVTCACPALAWSKKPPQTLGEASIYANKKRRGVCVCGVCVCVCVPAVGPKFGPKFASSKFRLGNGTLVGNRNRTYQEQVGAAKPGPEDWV